MVVNCSSMRMQTDLLLRYFVHSILHCSVSIKRAHGCVLWYIHTRVQAENKRRFKDHFSVLPKEQFATSFSAAGPCLRLPDHQKQSVKGCL